MKNCIADLILQAYLYFRQRQIALKTNCLKNKESVLLIIGTLNICLINIITV